MLNVKKSRFTFVWSGDFSLFCKALNEREETFSRSEVFVGCFAGLVATMTGSRCSNLRMKAIHVLYYVGTTLHGTCLL